MRIATFTAGGAPELGIVKGANLVPLSRVAPQLARGMIDLIARWDQLSDDVEELARCEADVPLSSVRLLAPVPRPGKILAIGLNYADHVAESGLKMPERQIWFSKSPNTANGPYDPVQLPRASSEVDYEVELVAVVGKGGRHVAKSEAASAVFGYCIGNDVSARDWQMATTQWVLGKSFDTHGPFGPWITTADEVGDPHRLGIRCLVNDVMRQNSNTRHLIFNIWDQIAHVSQVVTLEPGDLLFTGTPGGVGLATKNYLKPGDRVRCEADMLGHIENRFEPE
jgi:2-keto-4-pentenoate hydratase/2-oxohepta-3-ene-1,7-dioic acid hydratase in catechol pathway